MKNWRRHQKDIVACAVFNTSVDTFRKKFLMLLDDVEQFFLWVVAAMLDGRRIGFDWLNPMWKRSVNGRMSPRSSKVYIC